MTVRKKRLLRTTIAAAWAVTMLWVVRYEAYPEFFTHALPGYSGLIAGDVVLKDSWMKMVFKGEPIGYSQTSIETQEDRPGEYYCVTSRLRMKLRLMGEVQKIDADTEVNLDVMRRLQNFSFSLHAEGYRLKMKAVRTGDETFKLVTRTGNSSSTRLIEIPDDVVLYSPMTEMVLRDLKPGQTVTIKTLDPASLSAAAVVVRALRTERVTVAGEEREATVLESEYQGMRVLSWVGKDGESLRQETPLGWTMEKCTIEEAFEALRAAGRSDDMLRSMAVPCRGTIKAPRRTPELRLKLTGVAFTKTELASNRQGVESIEGDETVLVVRSAHLPKDGEPGVPLVDGAQYLAASPAIQSDHPDIIRVARNVTRGETTPLARALAICDWVDTNVEDVMTISLPSALDVLRTKKGDCNEHTYLYVALARAAGLPAAVKVGLAYHKGSFYYHAWPAVYVGNGPWDASSGQYAGGGAWVEMDPTWGQRTVDATHIALVEGELPSQVGLMKVMGTLRIELLEER